MTVDEGIDITKTKDRGVLKRIIKEGEGTDTPTVGCQVTVHYTGTLVDGTKFDSSRDRNEPFEFQLGKGKVIKAWEAGIATMRKGEVCVLTCAPPYAYGPDGNPPIIPPNATLLFEIEMLHWKIEDLSPNKNKGILRRILEQGSGHDTPNDGALVTVELEGRFPEGEIFDSRTVSFVLGDGVESDVCDGIQRALEKFTLGERSRLTLQPKYGFRSEGNAAMGVPPDAVVEYTVKLVSFEKAKEPWAMDGEEKLEQANILKERGTGYFKENKYQLAIKKYKKVVSLLEDVAADESAVEARGVLLAALLNLTLACLRAGAFYAALEHANGALALDPDNVKGLFRRGQAALALEDAEGALRDFERVVEVEPENKAAANQIKVCRSTIAKQNRRERQLYANMFDKFAKHDSEVELRRSRAQAAWGAEHWTDEERARKPTHFERENPNILMLDSDGRFQNM